PTLAGPRQVGSVPRNGVPRSVLGRFGCCAPWPGRDRAIRIRRRSGATGAARTSRAPRDARETGVPAHVTDLTRAGRNAQEPCHSAHTKHVAPRRAHHLTSCKAVDRSAILAFAR